MTLKRVNAPAWDVNKSRSVTRLVGMAKGLPGAGSSTESMVFPR